MDDFEKMFLMGILGDYQNTIPYIQKVRASFFRNPELKKVYKVILELHNSGKEPTLQILGGLCDKGIVFDLASGFVSPSEVSFASEQLSVAYSRHFLTVKGQRLASAGKDPEIELGKLLEIDSHKPTHYVDDSIKTVGDVMSSTLDYMDKIGKGEINRMLTGCPFIDGHTDGLEAGSFNIVAGRPGNGKTSYVINLLNNFEGKAIFYSLEMSEKEIGRKLISRNSGISSTGLKEKSVINHSMHKIIDTAGKLHQKKLWIDCKSGRTPSEVLAQCTYLKHTEGLDLIIVDYLQIMRLGRKTESRYVEVSGISRELTECAKILEIPMIALAQLSRGASERSDKRPIVTDLRGSGEIEQDAHKIIFLHVLAKYDQKEDPHLMEIIMPKNRSGEADVYIKHYVDQATSTHRAYTEQDARAWQAKGFQG